jgi:cytochrome c
MPHISFRGRTSSVGSSILAFVAISFFSTHVQANEPVDLHRFEKTVVAGELQQPMEMAIAPDGSIFLIELAGTLKRIEPTSKRIEIVGKIEVTIEQENGLIGLALDPKFAENGWMYLQYSPPNFSGQHISRFRFVEGKLDISSEQLIFKYEEQRRECCHHAGSMEFGPDGNLYIGTGDNTNPFNDSEGYAPIDQRPDRQPWDAQRSSGNTKSYNGKVLRIRPNADGGYSIPDGNLFPKDGSVGHPEIYVMGCRNPWRLNIDQKTGFLYWGDVGPDAGSDGPRGPRGYDEVNQARQAGNFGWPFFIGANRAYNMVDFVTGQIGPTQDPQHPVNRSINNTGAENLPPAQPAFIYYPAGGSAEFPEVGSGGRTACAGPVYYSDPSNQATTRFPDAYDTTLFAFEWSRNWILAVHMDEKSNIKRLERFLPDMPFVRPIDLQFDRHGSLYVIEYGATWGANPDAQLVRIDYIRGNRAPVAKAQLQNNIGREPLTVQFDATKSTDKDLDKLTYRWRAIRTGSPIQSESIIAQSEAAEFTFTEPGVYTVELQATDIHGASDVTTSPVIVGNARPQVSFKSPVAGDFYSPDQPITYEVIVRDLEDGTSDFDEAESGDLEAIDAMAPNRIYVQSSPVVNANATVADSPGLSLIRQSDCFNCHAAERPLVGPTFVDIANKYRDQADALEKSIERVMKGSTGVWGKVAMLPHGHHSPEQVKQMVEYVYSVKPDPSVTMTRGPSGKITVPTNQSAIRLEATYTDLGRGDIPPLSGTTVLELRSRRIQAESADEFRDTQPLGSGRAEGGAFLGAINNGAFVKIKNIQLDQVHQLALMVASAGAGGTIEVHKDAVDGPLLGSTVVEVNGDWEAFYEKTVEVPANTGRCDLYLVFKNPTHPGGLMNIDAIEFR